MWATAVRYQEIAKYQGYGKYDRNYHDRTRCMTIFRFAVCILNIFELYGVKDTK